MENKQRDYNKEYQREKGTIKRYTVRVPLYMSKAFEEKAKNEGLKPSKLITTLTIEALDKYIKKSKRT